MPDKKKTKKERPNEYEKKLAIDGTLDDVLKVSVSKKNKSSEEQRD